MITNSSEFLTHAGVKGMKWGKRKAREASDSSSTNSSKKPSRKERKKAEKQARMQADMKKADDLFKTALKNPNTLIKLNSSVIVTGKEFVDYMSAGGIMNARTTDVFATVDPVSKQYVLS